MLVVLLIFGYSSFVISQPTNHYYTKSDSVRIAYRVEGSGPPVLLIHGFIVDGTSWDRTKLKDMLIIEGYKVIIPDLRGNGQSDKPHSAEAYKNNIEVRDLKELIDHLNISSYDVVGYSRGSIVLAKLLTDDDRITKAVLGGMGADFTNAKWERRLQFADAFNGIKLHPGTEGAVSYAKSIGADIAVLGHLQSYQPVTSMKEIKTITTPVLVIAGDQDTDNGSPNELAELFPNGQLKIVSGDHNNANKTIEFATAVIQFLKD